MKTSGFQAKHSNYAVVQIKEWPGWLQTRSIHYLVTLFSLLSVSSQYVIGNGA